MVAVFVHHLSKIADWQSKARFEIFLTFNQRTLGFHYVFIPWLLVHQLKELKLLARGVRLLRPEQVIKSQKR